MTDPDPSTQPERPIPEPIKPEPAKPEPVKPSSPKAALPPPGMPRPAAPSTEARPVEPKPPFAPSHSPRRALPIFTAIGFLCLAAGFFYVWQLARHDDQIPVDPARIASLEGQTRDLRQRLASFETRLIALEQRPSGSGGPDLGPLESRLAALESRPPAPAAPAIAAPVDLGPLEARLAAAERVARTQAASLALDAGQPLGALPNAPLALTRFANTAPPTLATLRAAFPEVARRARAASLPAGATSWTERMTQSLAGLVTIRRGNEVLVGAASAVVLAAAQDRLDAGDLAGTLLALDALDPAAATAAASWKADAQALLAARAALASMARP